MLHSCWISSTIVHFKYRVPKYDQESDIQAMSKSEGSYKTVRPPVSFLRAEQSFLVLGHYQTNLPMQRLEQVLDVTNRIRVITHNQPPSRPHQPIDLHHQRSNLAPAYTQQMISMEEVVSSGIRAEGLAPVMVYPEKPSLVDYGKSVRRVRAHYVEDPNIRILQSCCKPALNRQLSCP